METNNLTHYLNEGVRNIMSAGVRNFFGNPKETVLEKQGIKVDKRSFTCLGYMGPGHSGHPDKKDIENFRYFISSKLDLE